MARVFSDGVEGQPGAAPESTLASGISAAAVSLDVQAGHGARFPATGTFSIRLEDATDPTHFELVDCTSRSTDTLTIGATTNAWDAGDKVTHSISKADLDAFLEVGEAAATYQALSGKGAASGYASLGADTKILVAELPFIFACKTAAESVTSSTTFQDDDQLTLTMPTTGTYLVLGAIAVDGHVDGDVKYTFNSPAGSSLRNMSIGIADTATVRRDIGNWASGDTSIDDSNWNEIGTMVAETVVHVMVMLVMGGTGGAFKLRWAQNASHATASRVLVNSYLLAIRVA